MNRFVLEGYFLRRLAVAKGFVKHRFMGLHTANVSNNRNNAENYCDSGVNPLFCLLLL